MSKKTKVIGIIGLLLTIFALVFGDTIYKQIKRRSVLQNSPSPGTEEPASPQDLATEISTEIIDDKGVLMRLVPAGDFSMGSAGSSHSVYLDAFYMDIYEVTNARYADCVASDICDPPHYVKSDFRSSYYGNSQFDNFPVIYVDWMMAQTYCGTWRGAHLPTEAQWEKAARGTDGRTYPWGEGISCDKANYDGDPGFDLYCVGETSAVGSYESGKSPYGLYDMAGNVFEWVSSLNKSYPYNAADGREDPTRGGSRVMRGGSWNEDSNDLQVFYRSWIGPDLSESELGFRCARPVQ